MTWQASIEHYDFSHRVILRIWRTRPDNKVEYIPKIPLVLADRDELVSKERSEEEAAMSDDPRQVDDFLRALMTVAWKRGIRPEGFEEHTNELKAVRDHLQDMRKLAKVT